MALIKARLRFTEIRGRVHLFNQVPGATSPVGTYYLSPSDKSDLVLGGLLVHDLFHHEAMGLGYDPRSEALTAFLDFKWPWYNSNYTVHNHPDIKGYLEELEAGTPREAKEQKRKLYQAGRATVKRAKTVLRSLTPKAYLPRIHKALEPVLDSHFKSGKPWTELAVELTVITENRSVVAKVVNCVDTERGDERGQRSSWHV